MLSLEQIYGLKNTSISLKSLPKWMGHLPKEKAKTVKDVIDMKKEFEKNNIHFIIIPLPLSKYGIYPIDYVWDRAEIILGTDFLDKNVIIMPLRLDKKNTLFFPDNRISFQHNLDSISKKIVDKLLKDKFKSKYSWTKKIKDEIFIKL